jgi:N-acetylglutamate synthase-like GNAT family acetyltransferase
MITIRKMDLAELGRIDEIDRTEHIAQNYKVENGRLALVDVDWRVGRWDTEKKIREWTPIADGWRNMWGAFDGNTLVGFSVYRPNLAADTAQFAVLHVSHDYRRKGIGKQLAERVIGQARGDGAKKIYVTAGPSKATTEFYLRLGFKLAVELNEELQRLEPDDIHMVMELS